MFRQQRKFEKAYEKEKVRINNIAPMGTKSRSAGLETGDIVETILDEISFIVFKFDEDGNVIRNKRNFPKIDWFKVIFNLFTILGKITALREAKSKL